MAAELQIETEVERIERWRYDALTRAGYSPEGARKLAERPDVDLHMAAAMIAQGCDESLALQILL